MDKFNLPSVKGNLKYHTRWSEASLQPLIDELTDLFAENRIDCKMDIKIQGPTITRFGVIPASLKDGSKIIKLTPTYKALFRKNDIRVYRSQGHIMIDIPWQRDTVYLGDVLNCEEYANSWGLPIAIGLDLQKNCLIDDMTDIPTLLVTGGSSSILSEYLEGQLLSVLMRRTPQEVEFVLFSSGLLNLEAYTILPYCKVISGTSKEQTLLSDLYEDAQRRLDRFAEYHCDNIYDFNEAGGIMRHKFVMITEIEHLLRLSKLKTTEDLLRLAELAGPCGIHLLVASKTPSSLRPIRDAFPVRVCLRTDSASDSILIAERKGAEEFSKKGTLYYLDGHSAEAVIAQAGRVTPKEVRQVIQALSGNYINARRSSIFDEIDDSDPDDTDDYMPEDPLDINSDKETDITKKTWFWSKWFR